MPSMCIHPIDQKQNKSSGFREDNENSFGCNSYLNPFN